MIRMQVQFDAAEAEALRRAASERGVSISAVVREAVDRCVLAHEDRNTAVDRSLTVAGRYSSGSGDVSARHDEYFADSGEK